MAVNDELLLLIKSRYPVIFYESADETYALRQLKALAKELKLSFHQWSLTDGLKRNESSAPYYQSQEPAAMMRLILSTLKPQEGPPGLFVLVDYHRYLEDGLNLRLFKDVVNRIKNTKTTFIIVAAEYRLPKDIETDSAHIVGGFPIENEIEAVVMETIDEARRTSQRVEVFLKGEDLRKMIGALKGLTIQQIRNVINHSLLEDHQLNINDLKDIEAYKKKVFDQEGLLEFCLTEDKGSIAGFENLKQWLAERKSSFSPNANSNLPPPRGVLLMGVQGCGKSLAIKVIARELALPLYRLDLGRMYSKYIGETENNLRKALAVAERLCPVCLWIDEIEKGFASSHGDLDGGVSLRILGAFLTWMQEHKSSCFMAATANDIQSLPPEFLRKGRFDEIFFVDLPDADSRAELFRIHLKKRSLNPEDFNVAHLTWMAEGFSGAEVEQAIIAALYRASSQKKPLGTEHIAEQLQLTKPLSVLKSEEIAELREWAKERTIPV